MPRVAMLGIQHLEQCLLIETRSDPHPWGRTNWLRSLRDDHCLGYWRDTDLVAISAYSLVLDEVSLLNIVVDNSSRGNGVGRQLLTEGLEWMQQFGGQRCLLEVRLSNIVARTLYKKLGFAEDGIRKKYYPLGEGHEDAVLMSADLPLI
ncbi:Ribosomal-protein-alanine acetyltransferase [Zhongshania aliphaticivorans]|uniref:[Ribosomal protein bS18]-alanine N-acetyltransferase n=1 Tax=Zhongshania aliphaticivorans TaxID=1470434 RepID=A0A5S9NNX2_9GAMM|nr:ribosomal protein S18-alanine N-acetyltransferase [Zhongshania aliphaticivorans]CAA0092044.1 Ribosomal-protein-alanine acetyltransferase [Zhongshania aliphaticivorans]CAA0099378.1 Ribosomal-protein-alanine acetyltransferase [Zhongshania aliphaticivorans]